MREVFKETTQGKGAKEQLSITDRVVGLIQNYLRNKVQDEPNLEEFLDYLSDFKPDIAESVTTRTVEQLFEKEIKNFKRKDNLEKGNGKKDYVSLNHPEGEKDTNSKLIKLFEFLKAYRSKMEEPVRNISNYEEVVTWCKDLPIGDGCSVLGDDQDSWLIVKKQDIPNPPDPPEEVREWLDGRWDDPFTEPKVRESKVIIEKEIDEEHKEKADKNKVEKFEDDAERVNIWNLWLNKKWIPWSLKAQPKVKIKKLYNKLFLLSQRLEREQEDLELVWGHGMLYWNLNGYLIRHPLLTTRVFIEFDDLHGVIKVSPEMLPTTLEVNFLQGTDPQYVRLFMKMQEQLSQDPINPWDKGTCTEFFTRIVNQLSSEGKVLFDANDLSISTHAVITYEPVIFIRRRKMGYVQDIETILEGLKNGNKVPAPIRSIVEIDDAFDENNSVTDYTSSDEILLPLPSNNEQFQVVERLASHVGVTVQGPPGTGKSYTIANLISHLLALGKRVLVTAKAERPLKVLREKIPENIRPLCITLLTDDAGSFAELEQAVMTMTENVISLDKPAAKSTIKELKDKLRKIRMEISNLKQRIKEISKRETITYSIFEKEYSLSELGKWLAENEEEYDYIPDELDKDAELPLSLQELKRLYELAGIILNKDREMLNYKLPDIEKLPYSMSIREIKEKINYYKEKIDPDFLKSYNMPSNLSIERINSLLKECTFAYEEAKKFSSSPWMNLIFQDVGKGDYLYESWANFYQRMTSQVEEVIKLKQYTSKYEIVLPSDCVLTELKNDVEDMQNYLEKSKKINFIAKLFNPKFKKIINSCRLNNAFITAKEDTSVLLAEIEQRIIKNNISNEWKKFVTVLDGPELDTANPRFEVLLHDYLKLIKDVFDWHQSKWKLLKSGVEEVGLSFKDNSLASIEVVINQLTNILNYLYYKDFSEKYNVIEKYLEEEIESNADVSYLWRELFKALKDEDWSKWDSILDNIRRLKKVEVLEDEFKKLKEKLDGVAPRWVEKILKDGGNGTPLTLPDNVMDAWKWRKAETWLRKLLSDDVVSLTKKLESLKNDESRVIVDLVTNLTWLNLSINVTEEQRRSLIAWQQQMKRIGKGTGKYALRRKQIAQAEMQKARNAVPVWIMPINKVIENFLPWDKPFDVVIVDESSQVDIFGILAMFRAKKALIVGDDKQISPQGVGINLGEIHDLMDGYLDGVPHKELYEPQYSLYDLAKQIFPGTIMLKEHFRCLPEIIQFSNDLMYQGEILPLREREAKLGEDWQPIVPIKVDNGYRIPGTKINEPEAEMLVEKILACCNDPRYKDMSMGVISLLGKEQAEFIETKLLDSLGPEEMRKRKIRCGDAYYFQGDERDIMFLSLVEAKGEHRLAVLNKEDDRRRFNVAVSRARSQLFLFYSIDPDEFHPEDVRSRFIRYCMNPHRFVEQYEKLEDACESEFERKVLKDLISLGYSVKPQYRVGYKRIDFVVFGMNEKLAIECDGDAYHGPERWEDDWNRQLILERLGWKFFRIRGSQYFRDREGTIKQLVETLNEMDIKPLL